MRNPKYKSIIGKWCTVCKKDSHDTSECWGLGTVAYEPTIGDGPFCVHTYIQPKAMIGSKLYRDTINLIYPHMVGSGLSSVVYRQLDEFLNDGQINEIRRN